VLAAIAVGLAVSTAILAGAGVPPTELGSEFASSFMDAENLRAVLVQASPLILVGVAASLAFRARFWNLGLEGQMIFGGIASTAVSLWQIGPAILRLPLMALAAILAGAAWLLIPLVLRDRFKVNEIISTLLLNYVASYFLFDLLFGPWKDSTDSFPHSRVYAAFERLPDIGWSISSALPLAVAALLFVWWLTQSSRLGFYLAFVSSNPVAALRLGVPIGPVTMVAVLISGALAALAGFAVSSGVEGRLTQGFYEGYGFSGVLIAFLARSNPLWTGFVAVLVAMLFVTGQNLQVFYQIPFAMVQLIQAIIVMCVAASEFFLRHRVIVQRRS
jgi:simple sugar transport system permease protein